MCRKNKNIGETFLICENGSDGKKTFLVLVAIVRQVARCRLPNRKRVNKRPDKGACQHKNNRVRFCSFIAAASDNRMGIWQVACTQVDQ